MNCNQGALYLDHFVPAGNNYNEAENAPEESNGLEARKFYEEVTRCEYVSASKSNIKDEVETSTPARNAHIHSSLKKRNLNSTSDSELEKSRLRQENKNKLRSCNRLFRFISDGDLYSVKQILESDDSSVSVDTRDSFNWTPLMCAAASGYTDIVKYLLEIGAPIYSPIDKVGNNAWDIAVKLNKKEIMDIFFAQKVKKEKVSDKELNEQQFPNDLLTEHCHICNVDFPRDDRKAHLSSTVHLFKQFKGSKVGTHYHLSEDNIGYRILKEKGWSEEQGLGPDGQGDKLPIATVLKRDRTGLGMKYSKQKRVTHFKSFDHAAVKSSNLQKGKRTQKKFSKKTREQTIERSRKLERDLRADMNQN